MPYRAAAGGACTLHVRDPGDRFLVHVLRLDSESYRRAFWREVYRNGHTIGHVPRTFEEKVSLLLGVAALFGAYTVATLLYRRLSLIVKRLRRPTYYERERERRQKLAVARREVRRHHTLNPQPTFDAIRAAIRTARSSPEAALALRLDPDCIPATGEEYVRKPDAPRIPRKVISWLVRRQVA